MQPLPVKWVLRHLTAEFVYRTGLLALFDAARRMLGIHRVVVLAYHGIDDWDAIEMFTSPDVFARQCRAISRRAKAVTIGDVCQILCHPSSLREDVVCVTFDDGYKDNLTHALRLAEPEQVPLCVFLTTDCISLGEPTFAYALIVAILSTSATRMVLPNHGIGVVSLEDRASRLEAIRLIDAAARPLSAERRRALLGDVLAQAEISRDDPRLRGAMLTWDDVRAMRVRNVTFGAHTVTHPVLSLSSAEAVAREVIDSKAAIEREIGEPVRYFAYPYGSRQAITDDVVAAVRSSGFHAAVVLYPQQAPTDLFRIPRLMLTKDRTCSPTGRFSEAMFACELSGLFEFLRGFR